MEKVNMLSVISVLNYFLNILQSNFIDVAIVRQFFEHTFSYIGNLQYDRGGLGSFAVKLTLVPQKTLSCSMSCSSERIFAAGKRDTKLGTASCTSWLEQRCSRLPFVGLYSIHQSQLA